MTKSQKIRQQIRDEVADKTQEELQKLLDMLNTRPDSYGKSETIRIIREVKA